MKADLQTCHGVSVESTYDGLVRDIDLADADACTVSLENEIECYKWPIQVKRWLWHDKYYKGLAAYCRRFRPRRALELGTCTGAGAVCLAKYCPRVVTCDVTDYAIADHDIFGDRISFVECDSTLDILGLDFEEFDLIFVDLDHFGDTEALVHEEIALSDFRGDVFYDDIEVNEGMKAFWSDIHEPKIVLNWHRTGFGVVRYKGGVRR